VELAGLAGWTDTALHDAIARACDRLGIKLGKVGPALRLALTGGSSSPALEITLHLIGRERSLARIGRAVAFVKNLPGKA